MAMIPTSEGGDGMSYHVMMQEKEYSCAAAALCMILWMKKGKFLREDQARLLIEHCYARSKGNNARNAWIPIDWRRSGVAPDVLYAAAVKGLSMAHSRGGNLARVDAEAETDIASRYDSNGLLRKVSRACPGIIGVKRMDGWHAVVAANIVNRNMIVLDPACGIALASLDDIDAGGYSPKGKGNEYAGDLDFCILFPD
jgi:hypothetical protein